LNLYQNNPTTENFITAVWKDENGNPIELHAIHRKWHQFIREKREQGILRIGILAPFKYGKTPNLLGYALHQISLNRNLRCKIVCNDDMNAKKRVATVKQYIEMDEDFNFLYGDYIKPNKNGWWNMHAIQVHRESFSTDATLESAGLFVTGIGGTFDLIIFDDICDLNNSVLSPARRENCKQALENIWLSRLEPEGVALYIGTPWHEQDATHELLDKPNWAWLLMRVKKDLSGLEFVEYVNV